MKIVVVLVLSLFVGCAYAYDEEAAWQFQQDLNADVSRCISEVVPPTLDTMKDKEVSHEFVVSVLRHAVLRCVVGEVITVTN